MIGQAPPRSMSQLLAHAVKIVNHRFDDFPLRMDQMSETEGKIATVACKMAGDILYLRDHLLPEMIELLKKQNKYAPEEDLEEIIVEFEAAASLNRDGYGLNPRLEKAKEGLRAAFNQIQLVQMVAVEKDVSDLLDQFRTMSTFYGTQNTDSPTGKEVFERCTELHKKVKGVFASLQLRAQMAENHLTLIAAELKTILDRDEQIAQKRDALIAKYDIPKLTRGFNNSLVTAVEAIRYLAEHPRPSGGQNQFNSEHLHQIAKEAQQSLVAIRSAFNEIFADHKLISPKISTAADTADQAPAHPEQRFKP